MTFVYLLFNMLIVPGFAAAAFSNIYEMFNEGLKNTSSLFEQIFEVKSGDFFVVLIIQSAAGSIIIQMTSIVEIIWSYFSTNFLIESRKIPLHSKFLSKSDETVFFFGLYYAQQLVIIGIGIIYQYQFDNYSSSIPIIGLAVVLFLICRMIGDSHQFIIWHKNEIDSSGNLVVYC